MTHYRMLDREPSAILTVAGSEKKIYQGGKIFLNDGENFELRFFNPLQEKIGVEIIFNGQKKNDGLLVLKPGEDVILDRFLGEKKKMKYETYVIDGNNKSAVQAAALNGLVEFKFYKERLNNFCYFNQSFGTLSVGSSCTTGNISNSTFTTTGNSTFTTSNSRGGYVNPGVYSSDVDHSEAYYSTSDNLTKGITPQDLEQPMLKSKRSKSKESKIETGRIEKGPESNQDLKTVEMEFETNPFHIISYQLSPNSSRTNEITEIRNYCDQCSYRIRKQNWKYCPKCGNKLN